MPHEIEPNIYEGKTFCLVSSKNMTWTSICSLLDVLINASPKRDTNFGTTQVSGSDKQNIFTLQLGVKPNFMKHPNFFLPNWSFSGIKLWGKKNLDIWTKFYIVLWETRHSLYCKAINISTLEFDANPGQYSCSNQRGCKRRKFETTYNAI